MASTLYRTLLVGIGSTGRDVVERVKRNLEMQYPISPAGIPFVAYLVMGDTKLPSSSPLMPNEYFRLDSMGMAQYLEERCLRDPKFVGSLGLPRGVPLEFGTRTPHDLENTRLGWYLVFEREGPLVRGALLNQLERLFQAAAWGRPEDKGFTLESGTQVNVFVIAGIDDGFGSSVMLDFLELLQNLPFFREQDREYRTTVVLTTLHGLENAEGGALTYAALSELNATLLDDLKRKLPRDASAYYFWRTPIYEACYLVEATDERTVPLEYGEDRLEMVVEWLAQSITHPALHDPNTATFSHVVRAFRSDFPDPALPYYSGLVHVAYVVPRAELNQMFAGRYGQEVLGARGILSPPTGPIDAQKRVAGFWTTQELDPDALVNFDGEHTHTTSLALDVGKQQRATSLFSPDVPMPRHLAGLRQAIDSRLDLQKVSYLPAYESEVANQMRDVLVPRWNRALAELARATGGVPLGGLCAVQDTLAALKAKLDGAQAELDEKREETRTKHATLVEKAGRAETRARNALRNAPNWRMFLKFIGWALATTVPAFAALTWWVVQDLHATDPMTALSLATVAGLLSQPLFLCIGLMSVLCAARYLWEWAVGSWRVTNHGHNLPGWTTLGYILVGIPAFAAISGALLCRSFDPRTLPGELAALLPLTPDYVRSLVLRGLGGIGAVGCISAGWFAFWYVHTVRRIREAALVWVRSREQVAAQETVVYRADRAAEGYQQLSDMLAIQIAQWEARIRHVKNATERLEEQYEGTRDALYGRERRFRRLAVESEERANRIYASQVKDEPNRETQEFFSAISSNFSEWLDQPEKVMVAAVNDYIRERFEPYWAEHDLSGLIRASAPDAASFPAAVERALEWVTQYRPQWSYHAGGTGRSGEGRWETFGELCMIAGVGSEDDHDFHAALRSFRKVTGELAPIVYATGDCYELAITIQRRDLPLEELHEIFKYRTDYLALRDIHLGLNRPPVRHTEVISTERLRMREEARRERGPAVTPSRLPKAAPVVLPLGETGEGAPAGAAGAAATGSEDRVRAEVRALLGIEPGAPREKVQTAFERVQRDLTTARDGLLNTMNRYRHYAQVQQGALSGPSWYTLLGLPVDRGVADPVVREAYSRRQALLVEIYNELLVSAT
jgi:hypothetical protein